MKKIILLISMLLCLQIDCMTYSINSLYLYRTTVTNDKTNLLYHTLPNRSFRSTGVPLYGSRGIFMNDFDRCYQKEKLLSKDYLNSLFKYKDGLLYWKQSLSYRKGIGQIAGVLHKPSGYTFIGISKKRYKAHRLIWIMHNGSIPNKIQIDHKDRERGNNRIENLRLCTHIQNSFNDSMNKNNTSGYKGVVKFRNRWDARIMVNRKNIWLGRYDTKEQASEVYKKSALKYFGEFAAI